MPTPDNLPHNWEYDEKTDCVICAGCCFRYGAEHAEGNGSGWLCPNCGDGNGTADLPAQVRTLTEDRNSK